MTCNHSSLRDPMIKGDPSPPAQNDGERRSYKATEIDDVVSTITDDSLIVFHKFIFLNDLVVMDPKRSNRACFPPPGYLIIYEISLHAGLLFPPPLELIDISIMCGVSLFQFSYRAISVTVRLIAFFRD
ncbi:hypothetical protein IEQ34_017413 [Dendrobium chrysotoxum]|uniref:Uncharacterized protein n=1 Tax=Dendrobium chrysotoxum TaxID=161865 RepID=A0AAV7FTY2_DENCH|nr:hypothetical protein IEQ34_017413 [Dendrobium chrysotoxum]